MDNVTVTGSADGPWTVTFVGAHAGENQPRLDGDAASATSGTEEREIEYTFDAASQLTDVTDPDSTYAYSYDNRGRVLTVDNDGTPGVPNVILTSAYDAHGNRTSLSAEIDATDDFLNTYTYDALHRLTRVDQEGQSGGNTVHDKRVDFQYNAIGQYTEIARFNDVAGGSGDEIATSTYAYDSLGRITDLEYENGGTDLFTPQEWSYDSLNRVTQFVSQDGTSDYEYDITSQLTAADHDYQTDETYSYDDNGNRTMTGYTTGDNNQLTNDGTHSYEYDDEGNRTKRTNDTTYESTEYDWDYRNRLIRVTDKDEYGTTTQVVEYTYDVFDRRISKAVDTTSSFDMADAVIESFVYDDITGVTSLDRGNVVLDFVDDDGAGSGTPDLERRYLYSNAVDQILAQENIDETTASADRVFWMLADNLGTVRDLAANDGTIKQHYEYDSFGAIQAGNTTLTRHLFTGREWDAETLLQYNRGRWYDSGVGRWMSEDPMGFEASDVNISRYVGNAPIHMTDPTGYYEVTIASDGGTDSPTRDQYYEMFFEGYEGLDLGVSGSDSMKDADWLDHAIAFGYGFSDAATIGIAPTIGWVLGHDRGLHEDADVSYGVGFATPVVVAVGGAIAMPAAPGATTTVIGTTPIFGGGAGATTPWGAMTALHREATVIRLQLATARTQLAEMIVIRGGMESALTTALLAGRSGSISRAQRALMNQAQRIEAMTARIADLEQYLHFLISLF